MGLQEVRTIRLVWRGVKEWIFLVQSFYNALSLVALNFFHFSFQSFKGGVELKPPFLGILTIDQLKRMGWAIVNWYSLCNMCGETANHIFIYCSNAQLLSDILFAILGFSGFFQGRSGIFYWVVEEGVEIVSSYRRKGMTKSSKGGSFWSDIEKGFSQISLGIGLESPQGWVNICWIPLIIYAMLGFESCPCFFFSFSCPFPSTLCMRHSYVVGTSIFIWHSF